MDRVGRSKSVLPHKPRREIDLELVNGDEIELLQMVFEDPEQEIPHSPVTTCLPNDGAHPFGPKENGPFVAFFSKEQAFCPGVTCLARGVAFNKSACVPIDHLSILPPVRQGLVREPRDWRSIVIFDEFSFPKADASLGRQRRSFEIAL